MSAPRQRRLRSDAQRSRRALVDAASVILVEDPAAAVERIATAAGVGRATAFRHFPTRDGLIAEAWLAAASGAAEEFDSVALEMTSADEVPDALLAAAVRIGERYPLLIFGARPALSELGEVFAAADLRLRSAVERAQAAGVLRRDVTAAVLVEYLLSAAQSVLAGGLVGEAAVRMARTLAADGARVR